MQFRNEDRVAFGKGLYKFRKGSEKFYVNNFKWGQLTAQQRLTKIKEFRNVCMSEKDKDHENYSTISGSANNLSISPSDSGINTVPLSVLERMFEKAKSLVRNDGLVLEKPDTTDGSYIVAGSANCIFCVSPGKGGSFKCERSCINSRTKICEHVIAVVKKSGKLQQFVEWFRRSKCGASVSALALNGAPKSM